MFSDIQNSWTQATHPLQWKGQTCRTVQKTCAKICICAEERCKIHVVNVSFVHTVTVQWCPFAQRNWHFLLVFCAIYKSQTNALIVSTLPANYTKIVIHMPCTVLWAGEGYHMFCFAPIQIIERLIHGVFSNNANYSLGVFRIVFHTFNVLQKTLYLLYAYIAGPEIMCKSFCKTGGWRLINRFGFVAVLIELQTSKIDPKN